MSGKKVKVQRGNDGLTTSNDMQDVNIDKCPKERPTLPNNAVIEWLQSSDGKAFIVQLLERIVRERLDAAVDPVHGLPPTVTIVYGVG